ncbi:Hint domain-containing protein [Cereibacter sediminicola]|uniref:Hint domain-containing protein n=1 Tax=Cereibacter sediminicola TaxID=2584941 RepID=UPI001642DC8A|nr:Hint domain-containing protein [Cereibacter sediminicola]
MTGAGEQEPPRATAVLVEGFLGATPIATPEGWRPAESLQTGDAVLTFAGPPQPIRRAQHSRVHPADWPRRLAPLRVPVGALENHEELLLLSGQQVLLQCDQAESQFGEPFALVPAAALEGFRGIVRARVPGRPLAVTLNFAQEELVYAAGAALLRCPASEGPDDPLRALLARAESGRTPALSLEQSLHLVACLVAEEAGAVLRQFPLQAARARGANRP